MTPLLRNYRVEVHQSHYIDIPAASEAHALHTAKFLHSTGCSLLFRFNDYGPNLWTATALRPETSAQAELLASRLASINRFLPFSSLPDHVAYPLKNRIDRSLRDLSALSFTL